MKTVEQLDREIISKIYSLGDWGEAYDKMKKHAEALEAKLNNKEEEKSPWVLGMEAAVKEEKDETVTEPPSNLSSDELEQWERGYSAWWND